MVVLFQRFVSLNFIDRQISNPLKEKQWWWSCCSYHFKHFLSISAACPLVITSSTWFLVSCNVCSSLFWLYPSFHLSVHCYLAQHEDLSTNGWEGGRELTVTCLTPDNASVKTDRCFRTSTKRLQSTKFILWRHSMPLAPILCENCTNGLLLLHNSWNHVVGWPPIS